MLNGKYASNRDAAVSHYDLGLDGKYGLGLTGEYGLSKDTEV